MTLKWVDDKYIWKQKLLALLPLAESLQPEEKGELAEALDEISQLVGDQEMSDRYRWLVLKWVRSAFEDEGYVYLNWLFDPRDPGIATISVDCSMIFCDGRGEEIELDRVFKKHFDIRKLLKDDLQEASEFLNGDVEAFRVSLVKLAGELLGIARSKPLCELPPIESDLETVKALATQQMT